MRPIFAIAAAAVVAALMTAAGPARAQANRTFVSGHGSDANPCTLAAPCRSFAQALTQTNAGGEITILDPAGYGPVTITKSVSIVNDGVGEAGVTTASAVDAIDINIGTNDVVNLRGLTLVGGGVGSFGVFLNNFGTLNIQNCVIRGFTHDGLLVLTNGGATVNVSDTIVSNAAQNAIEISPGGSGTVTTAVFNNVQVIDSGGGFLIDGLNATGAVKATIANSMASNNQNGISTSSTPTNANTQVMVVNSVVANSTLFGISEVGANSTTYLTKNTITGNATAFSVQNSGALFSFGDNYFKGNGSDGGAIALVATK